MIQAEVFKVTDEAEEMKRIIEIAAALIGCILSVFIVPILEKQKDK